MKRSTEGAFTITGPGVDSSSTTLGSAISKSITLASRLRRAVPAEDVRSLYVRKLGEEAVARIDVSPDVIEVHSFGATR